MTRADIDRAHRVGARRDQTPRPMIVKFKDWESRASVYKNRKLLTGNKIFVDLTKRRLSLKKEAMEKVKNLDDAVDFVFSDINCSLGVRLNNGDFRFFNSEDELVSILSSF